MKKTITALLFCMVLCATALAQNESDFRFDGRGTITGYDGWDTVLVIPAQIGGVAVTAIGDRADRNGGFTGVTLPAGIRSIGNGAFSGNKLTSVAIPAGVSVGQGAFSGNRLTGLTIPDGVSIGRQAFSGNQLTSLTIGNGVSIGSEAFSNHQLTSLTVGNGGSIDDRAFGGNSLRNLVLGEGIHINRGTFSLFAYYEYMCNGRRAGTYDNTVTYTAITEGDYQFIKTRYGVVITWYTGNEGNRLMIPQQLGGAPVKGIDAITYNDVRGLTGAFQRKGVSRMQLPDGLAFIGASAFYDNQLTSVTIPESVIHISGFGRNQLTSVTIPDSVTSIGGSAFSSNQLTSITIPDSVTSIGAWAFSSNQLTSITIPDSVTSIGGWAFEQSSFSRNQLTSVTIGANVQLEDWGETKFNEFYQSQGRRAGTYTYSGYGWRAQYR
jgi:hypothetical protein